MSVSAFVQSDRVPVVWGFSAEINGTRVEYELDHQLELRAGSHLLVQFHSWSHITLTATAPPPLHDCNSAENAKFGARRRRRRG